MEVSKMLLKKIGVILFLLITVFLGCNKKADMEEEGGWYGWLVGKTFFSIGNHSEVKGKSSEPQRIIVNLETDDVKGHFERIKEAGAEVIPTRTWWTVPDDEVGNHSTAHDA